MIRLSLTPSRVPVGVLSDESFDDLTSLLKEMRHNKNDIIGVHLNYLRTKEISTLYVIGLNRRGRFLK